ncbi:hypothetical protein [uncultured Arthrobacter sp.]|uniref:hypothetical protein n=1 Tax=uncultured Arthrobacter sp. TaxID=114050 RepID=UPI00262931C3|nr:hypothetical protein [uncultured Arthrobacter sp.]
MAMNGFEVVVLFAWIVPLLIGALVLYVVIRLGVKHGMRSYYADAATRPGPSE